MKVFGGFGGNGGCKAGGRASATPSRWMAAALAVALAWGAWGCCCAGGGGGRAPAPPPAQPRGGDDGDEWTTSPRNPRGIGSDPYFANATSAANVYVGQAQAGVVKIAVMPLKAATELIGASVSDMVVTELLRTRKYQLVERGQMGQVLNETELAMAGLSEAKAAESARMLGADSVVIGTVDEYGQQARAGDTYAVVGLAIRLIDCSSGKIVWSADLAKMCPDKNTPLPQHARAVVHELIAGLYQNLASQELAAPPAPPSGVSVSDLGMREATVAWDVPSLSVRYRIERAASAEGPFATVGEVAASAGRYTDRDGLRDGTTYYYRLRTINSKGQTSDPSEVVETMTAPPPDPPREVAARAPSSRCILLEWVPPRSEGIREYRVERAEGESGAWRQLATTAATMYTDGETAAGDIADSTLYRYRVFAVNRLGAESEASRTASVVSAPPPAPVPGFAGTADEVRCVPLSWEQPAEPDIAGYEIERADSPGDAFVRILHSATPGTTRFLDGGRDPGTLADGHEYRYRIRSYNKVGAYGTWTEPVAVRTRRPPPPPAGVLASQGLPRSSLVTWKESPDAKVTGYEIERTEEGSEAWRSAGQVAGRGNTSLSDRAGAPESAPTGRLKDGTAYLWRVRAVNTAGAKSDWSEPARAVTKPAPAAPSGVETTKRVAKGVKIRWKPNPEPDIAEYVVEGRSPNGWSTSWKTVARGPECLVSDTGLDDGEERIYRVKAIDTDTHESAWSEEVHGTARPIPDPPRALQAERTDGGVAVSFDPPRAGMSAFKVYRKKFIGEELLATVEEPRAVIAAPPPGDSFDVFVTAIDECGLESKPSERFTIGK